MRHHPDNKQGAVGLPTLAMPGSGKFPRAAHSGRLAKLISKASPPKPSAARSTRFLTWRSYFLAAKAGPLSARKTRLHWSHTYGRCGLVGDGFCMEKLARDFGPIGPKKKGTCF